MNRETEVITFTNISSKEFVWSYNSEEWRFPAGETKALPRYLAEHFAKHLADEFAIAGKAHEDYVAKILGEVVLEKEKEEINLKEEVEELNKKIEEASEEVEPFEGLEEALSDLSRPELMALAKERGIEVKAKDTKASLLKKLENK